MLGTVDVGTQDLKFYEPSAGAEAVAQLREPAASIEGARILDVNATPHGGGGAEILRSEIPLLRDLGLLVGWELITGDQTFFSVTRAIHNNLTGATRELTVAQAGLAGEEQDPVCGVRLAQPKALEYTYRGESYHLCSGSCREQFKATPGYFLRAMSYRS